MVSGSNEVIEAIRQYAVPVQAWMTASVRRELTPDTVGKKQVRILCVLSDTDGASNSDIRGMIARRFNKSYDNLPDFGETLKELVDMRYVQNDSGMFSLLDAGRRLHGQVTSTRPDLLEPSTSPTAISKKTQPMAQVQ